MILSTLIFILIINILPSFFISRDANKRGMNGRIWFFITLLTPIVGMILYAIVRKPLPITCYEYENSNRFETKKCPDCAENIREEAKVCRFCGYRFPEKEYKTSAESVDIHFPLQIKVIEDNALLFSEDSNRSRIIRQIPKDEIIIVLRQLGEMNEWLYVKSVKDEGYMLVYDTELGNRAFHIK